MSETFISSKELVARKPHECRICGDTIPAGETCSRYTGVDSEDGFYTLYFHLDCREWANHFIDYMDWQTHGPGDVTHEQVKQELSEKWAVDTLGGLQ